MKFYYNWMVSNEWSEDSNITNYFYFLNGTIDFFINQDIVFYFFLFYFIFLFFIKNL